MSQIVETGECAGCGGEIVLLYEAPDYVLPAGTLFYCEQCWRKRAAAERKKEWEEATSP